jgi:4-hydroxybenzoate polyprenyltransferase
VRFPLLATAAADPLAGWSLAAAADGGGPAWTLAGATLASLALYAGGMALNDFFDRRRDAVLHPTRPLPSGAAGPAAAFRLGLLLLLAGAAIGTLAGERPALVAALLAFVVLAYDALLKRSRLAGSLAMGAARGLSLCLGAAAGGDLWAGLGAAVLVGAYVAAVTAASTCEERPRRSRAVAALGLAAAAVPLVGAVLQPRPAFALLPAAVAAGWVLRETRRAASGKDARSVRALTRAGVSCIPLVDAAPLLGHGLWAGGLVVAALTPLARALATAAGPPVRTGTPAATAPRA